MEYFYVDKILYDGRPKDLCRLEKETRCYDLLDRLEIPYQRADHSPANTIEDCMEVEKVIGVNISKNLFLCNRQETGFYLLLMPGLKPFKTRIFSKLIGSSRLSFADERYMEKFLDITPGSVSILGLMNDRDHNVQLVIDKDVISENYIRCHPCVNTSTLKIKTEDVLRKLLPAIGHEPVFVDLPWKTDGE